MEYTKVTLCRINGKTCFGCCGHHFGSKEELLLAIKKNTLEYKNKKSLNIFMQDSSLRDVGLCRNLVILKYGSLGCPGHPMQAKKELRHCDIYYECKISFLFSNEWDNEKKQKFLEHIKDMDSIEYSLLMSDEKTLTKLF